MDLYELGMMLDTLGVKQPSVQDFQLAAQRVKEVQSHLEDDQQLQLYALYKQCTEGDISLKTPIRPENDMIACAKYDAWKAYEGFPRDNAAKVYVYLINELVNDIDNAKSVFEKMKGNENEKIQYNNGLGFSVSTLNNNTINDEKWSNNEAIFDAVVQSDKEKILECIKAGVDINMNDANGLTPLHFAADRGLDLIVSCLIELGANIEACDNDKKTPLLYACYCEQNDVIKVLVESGAKVDIENLVNEDISTDTIQFIKDILQT